MPRKIRIARGTKEQLRNTTETLPEGFPVYITDENKLYISKGQSGTSLANTDGLSVTNADHSNTSDRASSAEQVDTSYLLDKIYPIGSIYITTASSTLGSSSPASWLGGVWERIEGCYLYAASSTDTVRDDKTRNSTGTDYDETQWKGMSAAIKIQARHLPPHKHIVAPQYYGHGMNWYQALSHRPYPAWNNGDQFIAAQPQSKNRERLATTTELTSAEQSDYMINLKGDRLILQPPVKAFYVWRRKA